MLFCILRILPLIVLFVSGSVFAEGMDYAAVYEKAAPSVVMIAAFPEEGPAQTGTGFAIDGDKILTNRHVIWDDVRKQPAARILVFLKPIQVTGRSSDDLAKRFDAEIDRVSERLDLTVLKVNGLLRRMVPLKFSENGSCKVGHPTAAIGHPDGGSRWSLTTGRISAEVADLEGVQGRAGWQIETAINPGNSGGPLLDKNGNVLGINSVIVRYSESGTVLEGINFAIKGEVARQWLATGSDRDADDESESSTTRKRKTDSVTGPAPSTTAYVEAPQNAAPIPKQPIEEPKALRHEEVKPPSPEPIPARPDVKPGTVFTPNDIQKMISEMEQAVEEMEADFERRRKQLH